MIKIFKKLALWLTLSFLALVFYYAAVGSPEKKPGENNNEVSVVGAFVDGAQILGDGIRDSVGIGDKWKAKPLTFWEKIKFNIQYHWKTYCFWSALLLIVAFVYSGRIKGLSEKYYGIKLRIFKNKNRKNNKKDSKNENKMDNNENIDEVVVDSNKDRNSVLSENENTKVVNGKEDGNENV